MCEASPGYPPEYPTKPQARLDTSSPPPLLPSLLPSQQQSYERYWDPTRNLFEQTLRKYRVKYYGGRVVQIGERVARGGSREWEVQGLKLFARRIIQLASSSSTVQSGREKRKMKSEKERNKKNQRNKWRILQLNWLEAEYPVYINMIC